MNTSALLVKRLPKPPYFLSYYTFHKTHNVYDYILRSNDQKYLKVTVCDQSRIVFGSIIKKLRTIEDIDVLDVAHMSKKIIKSGTEEILVAYCYTEITNKNVNKWTALEYIMSQMNITKDEVAAIGDNVNDKEMVEEAGLGIAMGNCTEQLKEIAKVQVATNNQDGVCEAFQKYINIWPKIKYCIRGYFLYPFIFFYNNIQNITKILQKHKE